jgi:cysteine-rich repeat protein
MSLDPSRKLAASSSSSSSLWASTNFPCRYGAKGIDCNEDGKSDNIVNSFNLQQNDLGSALSSSSTATQAPPTLSIQVTSALEAASMQTLAASTENIVKCSAKANPLQESQIDVEIFIVCDGPASVGASSAKAAGIGRRLRSMAVDDSLHLYHSTRKGEAMKVALTRTVIGEGRNTLQDPSSSLGSDGERKVRSNASDIHASLEANDLSNNMPFTNPSTTGDVPIDGMSVGLSDIAVSAASQCGDGGVDIGEECDDNNLVDGDGCSSICTIEGCDSTVRFATDPGGPYEDYINNAETSTHLSCPEGSFVKGKFTQFKTEYRYDFVRLSEGDVAIFHCSGYLRSNYCTVGSLPRIGST